MSEPQNPSKKQKALAIAIAAALATALTVPSASPSASEPSQAPTAQTAPQRPTESLTAPSETVVIIYTDPDLEGGPDEDPTAPTAPPTTQPPAPPTTEAPPTTQQQPAPVQQPTYSGSVPDIIRSVFAPYGENAVSVALRVAECESGFSPTAQNPSGASGVFQIMAQWADEFLSVTGSPYYDGRFDPSANSRFAAWLAYEAQGGGWGHWVCH